MKPLKHPLQTREDQARDEAALRARRRCNRAQARYKKTAKGKATETRYNRSATHLAAAARYRATEKGRKMVAEQNARRIFIGMNYQGLAETVEQATVIQTHIKGRLRAFTRQQAGTETEGAS